MTRREEAIQQAAHSLAGYYWETAMDDARAAIAAYEAHMRPEVASRDDADALPIGSVVLIGNWVWERDTDGWITTGIGGSEPLPVGPPGPARVIHWGTP